jgi:hypothetical protein
MKLYEVASADTNLVLVLRNLISQANTQNQPSYLSWDALNKVMQNIGDEQFDYDSFKNSYDTSPMVKNLIHKFDNRGVELKTKKSTPNKKQGQKQTDVEKMAKAAVDTKLK